MTLTHPKRLVGLGVLVAIVLLAVLAATMRRTPPRSPLPNPNGYDDFLKAATVLSGDVANAARLDRDRLRALVATNAEPLHLIRLGLGRSCSIPTDSAATNVPGLVADLARLKSLPRLLAEEGRLAEMEGRYADAAHSYLDAIRFGNEMSRGGFILTRLVGIACEAIGDTPLSKLAPKLNPEEAHQVVVELEKIDSTGITWEEVLQGENTFARYQLGKWFNPVTWAVARWQGWRTRQRSEMRHKRIAAHLRLLTVELALRCYQSGQGQVPAALEQLVPRYLQRVPSDPFSSKPLIYLPQGTNWLLYSVGEDGVDDGGKSVARSVPGTATKGDLFYNSPY